MGDEQLWALAEAKQRDLAALEEFGIRRTNEHYYVHVTNPLPYSLLDTVTPDDFLAALDTAIVSDVTSYQGFYGCVNLCDYCPFGTLVDSAMPSTLDAMVLEHELWAEHVDPTLSSFYFGGGTASVVPPQKIDALLESLARHFTLDDSGEWKFELYPKRYADSRLEKLLAVLGKWGFSDLNIDVQTSNQRSLDEIGRSNSSFDAYVDLVEKASRHGFSSITTTLMAGLPYETRESFAQGLRQVAKMQELSAVIVYPIFNTANRKILVGTEKGKKYACVEEKDVLLVFADLYLREQGFHAPIPGYYLRNKPKQLSIEQKFGGATHFGFGTSARGCFTGEDRREYHYHSHSLNHDYLVALQRGELPVERLGILSTAAQARHYFLQSLASLQPVDVSSFEEMYGVSLLEDFGPSFKALERAGVLHTDGSSVQLLEAFRSEEILGHLRDPVINAALSLPAYANDGRNLNWGIHVPEKDKRLLLSYA